MICIVFSKNLTSQFIKFCNNKTVSIITDPGQLKFERSKLKGIQVSSSDFAGIISEGDIKPLFKSKFGVFLILMIILCCLLLISLAWFLGFCCCLDRTSNQSDKCSLGLNVMAMIVTVLMSALLITACVFVGLMNKNHSSAVCSIYRVPSDFLNGVKLDSNRDFMGLKNFSNVLGRFGSTLSRVPALAGSFSTIASKPFTQTTSSALQSLRFFGQTFKPLTTWDGRSKDLSPNSILNLKPHVSDEILEEFNMFDSAISSMMRGAQAGLTLTQSNSFTSTGGSVSKDIQDIKSQIDSSKKYFEENISKFFELTGHISATSSIIYIIAVIAVFLVICAVCFISFSLMQSNTDKQDKRRGVSKCLLIGVTFLGFLIGLAGIFSLVLSTTLFTICKDVPNVLYSDSSSVSNKFAKWGFKVDSNMNTILNNCFGFNSQGSVIDYTLINQSEFGNATLHLIDGITSFKSARNYIDRANLNSVPIDNLARVYENYRTSYWSDQPNALLSLKELNDKAKCGGINFALNSKNCTQKCIGIFNSVTVPAMPPCSAEETTRIFKSLFEFVTQEKDLMNRMLSVLNSNDINSLKSQNTQIRLLFKSFDSDYAPIIEQIGGYLTIIPNITGGIFDATNCTLLRTELMNFESQTCFKFNNYLYIFSSLLCPIVFLIFLIVWALYFSLLCIGEKIETIAISSKSKLQDKDEVAQIKLEEEVPVY
jgi:hypothetical protein